MNTFLLLPSHLFPLDHLKAYKQHKLIMIEGLDYFARYKYHKKRLVFFIESMRNYRDSLKEKGYQVTYIPLDKKKTFLEALDEVMKGCELLEMFAVEERYLDQALREYCQDKGMGYKTYPSPLFLQTEEEMDGYFQKRKTVRMQHFYEGMRKKQDILLEKGKPKGGKWSFDAENRKPLPKSQHIPRKKFPKPSPHQKEVRALVEKMFPDHPGSTEDCWLPVTRKQALLWLEEFIEVDLLLFGPYEDAISDRDPFLFHSVLSPLLNIGLLTPKEVIDRVLEQKKIPLNSLEGFIRQVIGWREFIRGIDRAFGAKEASSNFFGHKRKMTSSWYSGDTGIVLLDKTIQKAVQWGYCHHIERLMVLSNLMLLSEIHPKEVFVWFMELFVDSADWVMGPNVYGMGQFSDGGIFATKPYICGSNYLLKMSDHKKEESCLIIDGLYWRFVEKKKRFLQTQPRLNMMVKLFEKMPQERKKQLRALAEQFLHQKTKL
ncbi:MAG: cryptochrome/photolyase family protein [Chlamydiota bacterium]